MDPKKYLFLFREEARDHLAVLSKGLLELERGGTPERVRALLRAAHTLKGSARMVGLADLGDVAHRMEDLLKKVEAGEIRAGPEIVDYLLLGTDAIRDLAETGAEGRPPSPRTLGLLEQFRGPIPVPPPGARPPLAPGPVEAAPGPLPAVALPPAEEATVRIPLRPVEDLNQRLGELGAARARLEELLFLAQRARGEGRDEDAGRLLSDLGEFLAETGLVVEEAQRLGQDLLMFPVGSLVEELEPAVREVARTRGRPVRLVVEGGETRLDKRVIEALKPALLHMVRNAVDHGIEPPEERSRRGKPPEGTLRCAAALEGDRVVLTIEDDGRGMDPARLKAAAVAKGLLDETRARALSDREAWNLIFLPGFSTAERLTEVSGRGIGMDVVKSNLEGIRGDVAVETEPGRWTRFTLTLPSTLLTLRSLLVRVGAQTYAVPLSYVAGVGRVDPEGGAFEGGGATVEWRDRRIPLVDLRRLLALPEASTRGGDRAKGHFVVLSVHDETQGVVVDEVLTEREVLVKPLDLVMHSSPVVSGATLFRRGEPGFILNLFEIFRAAHGVPSAAPRLPARGRSSVKARVLIVDDSATTRLLERGILEEAGFDADAVASGEEALAAIERERYDLFVVDLDMPGMSGFDLLRALRARGETRETPSVIVSARGSDEDKRLGLEAGAQGYFVKSDFDQKALVALVRRLAG